ncbi:helix-turn-helix transcriptional regulator [candidate division WOR-3 bacterium]|nr:helix-turn-helix transcriptional regulator [candidate division WOR-3 bacterium]
MARLAHRTLSDLVALGDRLRSLRARAGLSQMQLARAIGFNPTHGYKYVLRLEKGLVPNPTLRTIASILDALHASWQELADVLPQVSCSPLPVAPSMVVIQPPAPPRSGAPPIPTQRGSRPLREWLRQQRRDDQRQRGRRLWQQVADAEERTDRLVASRPAAKARRRDYLTFVRTTISTINAVSSPRPQVIEATLTQAVQAAAASGLDRELLLQLQTVCREVAGR